MLSFVVSVANLGEETLPRKILLARANCSTVKGYNLFTDFYSQTYRH